MEKLPAQKGVNCPLYRKDVSKVCHNCNWYVKVRGKNPQSNEEIDHWGCAMAWGPILTIDNTQQQRGIGAAIEDLRNLVARGMHQETTDAAIGMAVKGILAQMPSQQLITEG